MISDKRLSGRHCLVELIDGNAYLSDLSTNGTYLNTEKIAKEKRVQMREGD